MSYIHTQTYSFHCQFLVLIRYSPQVVFPDTHTYTHLEELFKEFFVFCQQGRTTIIVGRLYTLYFQLDITKQYHGNLRLFLEVI